jgi:hypothetical protein
MSQDKSNALLPYRRSAHARLFLSEMERGGAEDLAASAGRAGLPEKDNGRPSMPLATMLRIHFMQQWFGYSVPAMEVALHAISGFPTHSYTPADIPAHSRAG